MVFVIRMSHWRHRIVDGAECWISCKPIKLPRNAGRLQLIQNLAPSTIFWRHWHSNVPVLNFEMSSNKQRIPMNHFTMAYFMHRMCRKRIEIVELSYNFWIYLWSWTVHSSDVSESDNTEHRWTSLGTSVCLLLKDLSKDEFAEFFMDH